MTEVISIEFDLKFVCLLFLFFSYSWFGKMENEPKIFHMFYVRNNFILLHIRAKKKSKRVTNIFLVLFILYPLKLCTCDVMCIRCALFSRIPKWIMTNKNEMRKNKQEPLVSTFFLCIHILHSWMVIPLEYHYLKKISKMEWIYPKKILDYIFV